MKYLPLLLFFFLFPSSAFAVEIFTSDKTIGTIYDVTTTADGVRIEVNTDSVNSLQTLPLDNAIVATSGDTMIITYDYDYTFCDTAVYAKAKFRGDLYSTSYNFGIQGIGYSGTNQSLTFNVTSDYYKFSDLDLSFDDCLDGYILITDITVNGSSVLTLPTPPAPSIEDYTELVGTITASTTSGYYNITIPKTENGFTTESYEVAFFDTTFSYDTKSNANHCYPRANSNNGWSNGDIIINFAKASYFTSNTSGGSPDCSGDGTYYVIVQSPRSINGGVCPDNCYYFPVEVASSSIVVPPEPCTNCTVISPSGIYTSPDYKTRFLDLNYSYSGNDVTLEAEYYLDANEIDTTNPNFKVELIRYCYASVENTPDYTCYSNVATTTGTTTNSYELQNLEDGQYDVLINFYNYASTFTSITPFADTYIYSNFTIASGTVIQTGDVGIGVVANTNSLGGYWKDLFDLDRQIFTRHPFAWIEDFLMLVIEEMTTEPTQAETELPLLTLDLNVMSGEDNLFANDYGHVEMDFFSQDIIVTALGEDTVTLIRNVISYALILVFMFGVWRRVMKMFNNPVSA